MNDEAGNSLPTLNVDGMVGTIMLRRPDVANRLSQNDIDELIKFIDQVNGSNVLVLRIFSTGNYFCSGYNIGQMESGKSSGFDALTNALEDCRPVTIAALQGGVYGGGTDLALACDFRVGTPNVEMFMPAARLGLHFYQRGLERYVSRLGLNTAKQLLLTAEKIPAEKMLATGFLTHLVDPEELSNEVNALTDVLADMAPLSLLGMKKHLNRIARNVVDTDELQLDIVKARQSADLIEGRNAWREKRKPKFTGV